MREAYDSGFLKSLAKKIYELTGNLYSEDRIAFLSFKVKELMNNHHKSLGRFIEDMDGNTLLQEEFINRITVGETYFFRDYPQLKAFRDYILSKFKGRTVKIASLGCSTGEEVYSLACILNKEGLQGKVYGFDINQKALKVAEAGVYKSLKAKRIPDEYKSCFVQKDEKYIEVPAKLKSMVEFKKLNLIEEKDFKPYRESMDIVFCRHVLIYFDESSKKRALGNIESMLKPGGYLILSPAEMLPHSFSKSFTYEKYEGFFFYRRLTTVDNT